MNYNNLDDIHYLYVFIQMANNAEIFHKSPAKNIFTVDISIDTLIIVNVQFLCETNLRIIISLTVQIVRD